MDPKRLDADFYAQVVEHMPITCVDVLILSEDRKRFLMGLRKHQPAKGLWWFPGGRLFKGETLQDCAIRKVKEETGIQRCYLPRRVKVYETQFDDSEFGVPIHTVNHLYEVRVPDVPLQPDDTTEALRWFEHVDELWHWEVRKLLILQGFAYPD